jgi:hypothetical protein
VTCLATAQAQDEQTGGETSAAAIAQKLADPNATLGQLSFPLDYVAYQGDLPGADSQSAWKLSFQPSLPYSISEEMNLFVRPLIPVFVDQPVPVVGDQGIGTASPDFNGTGVQLGDIGFDVALGKSFSNGMLLLGGVVGTLPTATDDSVGLDQYLLGPEVLVAKVGSWGAIGGLLTHQWDVAGEDSFDTNITAGQYFFTYNLKDAWQISMSPTFSYNHEADSGNKLTFPLGFGMSKTVIFGETPWRFNLQYWHYIETPDLFGPESQIRFSVTPVVPLPW